MLVAAEDEINLAQEGGNGSIFIFPSILTCHRDVSACVQ